MPPPDHRPIGSMLRAWRERRRFTQLDLALDSGVSTRHLSFVETGRAQPGREMLLRVLQTLEVPFREQNQMLLSAGYAPEFPERRLGDRELAPIREALKLILDGHDPYPGIAVDRHWNVVAANRAMSKLTARIEVDAELLEPPVNALRLGFHPRGLAPAIVNLGRWQAHFREHLERQLALGPDDALVALLDEIAGYPVPDGEQRHGESEDLLGTLRLRAPDDRELAFFGMFAGFDTPFEVTSSELALELLFPADCQTALALRALEHSKPPTEGGLA